MDSKDIEYVAKQLAALSETEKRDPVRLAECARDALRDYEFELMIRDMDHRENGNG